MRPSTEAQARQWVEENLGRAIPDATWGELVRDGYLAAVLDRENPLGAQDLLDAARVRLLKIHRPGGHQRRKPKNVPWDALIPEPEIQRAKVFSRYLGRLAGDDVRVRRVRGELFDGQILSVEEAQRLLLSVALRFYSHEFFKSKGIPLLAHDSGWFDPTLEKQVVDWTLTTGIRIQWKGGELQIEKGLALEDATRHHPRLEILGDSGHVAPGSVFDDIRRVSDDIGGHYDWPQVAATWFILTGQPPQLKPIAVKQTGAWRNDHHHFTLTIRVEPWVSPKTVLDIYRAIQREVVGYQSRPLSEKNLQLFEFISDRMQPGQEAPPWRALMSEWNQKYHGRSGWEYTDVRIFARDYRRTGRQVVYPGFRLIQSAHEGRGG